jgi:ribosomal protein S12 methylthiotransferase
MDELLAEAAELADAGVRELLVIAQDITRYGTDFNGEHQLAALLRELCKLDFHWVRLHYLYPDEITDELIDTIAAEPKIVKYLDIPIQHCNDGILKAMNRRDTKAELLALFGKLRARIPGLVLRTSLITGLPGEGEAELRSCATSCVRPASTGRVFPSPEEGTRAAQMDNVDTEEAAAGGTGGLCSVRHHRDYNDPPVRREVRCEGFEDSQMCYGRSTPKARTSTDRNLVPPMKWGARHLRTVRIRHLGRRDHRRTGGVTAVTRGGGPRKGSDNHVFDQ